MEVSGEVRSFTLGQVYAHLMNLESRESAAIAHRDACSKLGAAYEETHMPCATAYCERRDFEKIPPVMALGLRCIDEFGQFTSGVVHRLVVRESLARGIGVDEAGGLLATDVASARENAREDQYWVTVTLAAKFTAINRGVISKAANDGQIRSNGKKGLQRRLEPASVMTWAANRSQAAERRESDADRRCRQRRAGKS